MNIAIFFRNNLIMKYADGKNFALNLTRLLIFTARTNALIPRCRR